MTAPPCPVNASARNGLQASRRSATVRAMPKRKKNLLDTLSDKLIADVIRNLPDKEREPLEAVCMGQALVNGEIVIDDGPDLPADIRKKNLARIKKIADPKVRAEMLNPKTPPVVVKPRTKKRAAA